ncbi:hypothetical protein [Luteitalea sp.]|uniref:hypothetical protein n=1 Tax=Luteitalea sp. TaxID=2004800 RepID=UPI0025B8CBF5|nr:hypothetical protein [Luteitalea sp.]
MGWAARANPTVRDGRRPTRVTALPSSHAQPLLVFVPTKRAVTKKDGTPVMGPNNTPLVHYGFVSNAPPGTELSETHYFDGRAIRRRR